MNIKTFGPVDQRSLEQLKRCMEAGDAEFGVLCADHHPGYAQPIGGAIAYEGYVSPSGVGFDVGCGNKAARTDMTVADLEERSGVETILVPAENRTEASAVGSLEVLPACTLREAVALLNGVSSDRCSSSAASARRSFLRAR